MPNWAVKKLKTKLLLGYLLLVYGILLSGYGVYLISSEGWNQLLQWGPLLIVISGTFFFWSGFEETNAHKKSS
ncbi:hypothetical protein [Paenibacillus sp. FJAT-26967]|uniref:hypothetical protein n=1 Tax=Paenibacillus sp. FJAT-26967 TaxID=1729690 RepID=UPI0008396587|nr:hypothetical protein [Paenibacillus sp. FJAT-26967]